MSNNNNRVWITGWGLVAFVANFRVWGEEYSDDDAKESDGAAKDLDDENFDKEGRVGGISHGRSRTHLEK